MRRMEEFSQIGCLFRERFWCLIVNFRYTCSSTTKTFGLKYFKFLFTHLCAVAFGNFKSSSLICDAISELPERLVIIY